MVSMSFFENSSAPLCLRILECVKAFTKWGDNRFSDIPRKIRDTQKRLNALNKNVHIVGSMDKIKKLEGALDDFLESEELVGSAVQSFMA